MVDIGNCNGNGIVLFTAVECGWKSRGCRLSRDLAVGLCKMAFGTCLKASRIGAILSWTAP